MERNTDNQLHLIVFLTAFVQVCLVAMNTIFISHGLIVPMLITGFGISLVWTLNVKKIAFGTFRDRFVYAFGAMFGTGVGYYLATWIDKLIQ